MTKIMILGEAQGRQEEQINSCFVGASGIELLRMLHDANVIQLTAEDRQYINKYYDLNDPNMIEAVWQMHPDIYRTNVFMLHPPNNDLDWFCGPKSEAIAGYPQLSKSRFVRDEFTSELSRLEDELMCEDPNVILALGNTALWALCGTTGITKVRGTTTLSTHTVADFKVLPTYHPAAVLRQWELRPTTVSDLMKLKREMSSPYIIRPERNIWIEPSLEDLEKFYVEHIIGCDILSVDIETSGNQITCIGFAPRRDIALVIPIYDRRRKDNGYWPSIEDERYCWAFIRRVVEDRTIPKVFQNGVYDIAFMYRSYGIRTYGAIHDTMLLQHSLHPESLKGLGYLGSIYTDEGAWKHIRKTVDTVKRDE